MKRGPHHPHSPRVELDSGLEEKYVQEVDEVREVVADQVARLLGVRALPEHGSKKYGPAIVQEAEADHGEPRDV